MQKFKCHKVVSAVPMNRLEYNQYRGWDLPEDEDGNDEGFLVEYLDGGKSNHVNHKGYISWSPKEQFESGYSEVVEDTVLNRLVAERDELKSKTSLLEEFVNKGQPEFIDDAQWGLLDDQKYVMQDYLDILESRIKLIQE